MAELIDDILQVEEKQSREFMRVFRPFPPKQDETCRCDANEIILRGGKRASKSVTASALFGARVTGQPIIAEDGTIIPNPWPVPTLEYPRRYWIIGWDTNHIGQTIHRLLFENGQGGSFRIIRDSETGLYVAYNRDNPEHVSRVHESKLSEPVIPERFFKGGSRDEAFAWVEKKTNQFNSVQLNNGATIYGFPSSSRNPKQGEAVSGIWVDEDIQFAGHLKEWQDRLTDENGWFLWSAWPHVKNEALLGLLNRADMAEFEEKPRIRAFQFHMTDNPYLSKDSKEGALGRMDSDEEVARRDRGELLIDSLNMYQFSTTAHQIQRPYKGVENHYDKPKAHEFLLDMYLKKGGFPKEWTRYISIDPSNTRTACHSWVVPPVQIDAVVLGNVAIAEWEMIAHRFHSDMLAKALAERMGGFNYEAFIMDMRIGRQTHAGRAENAHAIYAKSFKKHKLVSRTTNYSFLAGCDEPTTRQRAVRELLLPQEENGLPSLMFVEEKCLETRREFQSYRKKMENRGEGMDSVLDTPASPRLYDAMASVEYFAAYIENAFLVEQAYVPPEMYVRKDSAVLRRVKKIRASQQKDEDVVYFGGGDYSESSDVSAYY